MLYLDQGDHKPGVLGDFYEHGKLGGGGNSAQPLGKFFGLVNFGNGHSALVLLEFMWMTIDI